MEIKRLASRENYRQVEKEWKYEWVFYVLSHVGIPDEMLEDCFPEDGLQAFDIKHKLRLRKCCDDHRLIIVDDGDGGLQIYVEIDYDNQSEQVLIAKWNKCRFNLRQDSKEINPAHKTYIEIIADPWAIFEEQEEDDEDN